jgi:membrane protease YdiL (CAAX protease family)
MESPGQVLPLTFLPFALLLAAVLGLWIHRFLWIAAFISAIVAAYVNGSLTGLAGLWLAILAALALGYRTARDAPRSDGTRAAQLVAALAFAFFALALGLLLLPGFERTTLVPETILSPGAAPYSVGLGFPKVAAGILILGLINPTTTRGIGRALKLSLPVWAATTGAVMMVALATGSVAFDPKWTAIFFAWAAANLFFTCLSEEAFFRGFVQAELAKLGGRAWPIVAIVASATLFGLAHFAGGPTYVIAGIIAGLGYAIAYARTDRIEAAMAVHFGVNAAHFLFFTYPRLA